MTRLGPALLALALLTGCPGEDPPPPPVSRVATTPVAPPPPAPGSPPVTSEPSSTDRARLLALTPAEALAGGVRGAAPGGLAPALAGEGALAMAEQLRQAGVPLEALDLCIVAFDRARERTRAGVIDDAARADLARALRVQAGDRPALLAWVEALADRAYVREDLPAILSFLTKVREVRALSAAARPR